PILRLIVRVDWDPREDESRAREMANHLGVISAENVTMTDYERFEVFLMHRRPEQWTVTWSLDAPVEGLPIPTADPLPEGVKIRVSEGVEGS
ncbi:MAG: hypothetical protein KDA75_21840, partial [Planctomycetaceae bacterium]|nr:hypothetical protein [Planctomycetaceae bacterium]